MFDTRGRPGFSRFPFKICDDVRLIHGNSRMTVVDFDEKGDVTVAWRKFPDAKPTELTMHHRNFVPWDGPSLNG